MGTKTTLVASIKTDFLSLSACSYTLHLKVGGEIRLLHVPVYPFHKFFGKTW